LGNSGGSAGSSGKPSPDSVDAESPAEVDRAVIAVFREFKLL